MLYTLMTGIRQFARVREIRAAGVSMEGKARVTYHAGNDDFTPRKILVKLNKEGVGNERGDESADA